MDRPNLELPQRVAVSRPIFDRRSTFFFVCGLIAVGLLGWLQLRPRANSAAPAAGLDLEAIALRLEDRNLHLAAAEAWHEHLASASLSAEQRARLEVRRGRLLARGGQDEAALAALYRAEAIAGKNEEWLGADFGLLVRDSLQRLGRYAELAREVEQRTSIAADKGALTGSQIVAEIGDEKITQADFERQMQEQIDALVATSPGLGAEQAEQFRKQLHDQYAKPRMKAQMLEQLVARRVLATEGRRRKLDQDPAYRARLAGEADSLLATRVTADVAAERGGVTPQDVERYFAAKTEQYQTPARGKLARIVCPDEAAAKEIIAKLDAGADFTALAKERSTDPAAKETGGLLDEPIGATTRRVPGVGDNEALHRAVWPLGAGAHSKEPVAVGSEWHIYRMVEKSPARTPELAEVRERVAADCAAARRDEVLEQFVRELFERERVRIAPAAATQPTKDAE